MVRQLRVVFLLFFSPLVVAESAIDPSLHDYGTGRQFSPSSSGTGSISGSDPCAAFRGVGAGGQALLPSAQVPEPQLAGPVPPIQPPPDVASAPAPAAASGAEKTAGEKVAESAPTKPPASFGGNGAALFQAKCMPCHMSPTDSRIKGGKPAEAMASGRMPKDTRPKPTQQEQAEILAYIKAQ